MCCIGTILQHTKVRRMSASGTPVLVGGLRSWTARIDQPPSGQHSPYYTPGPSGSVLFPTHIVIAYLLARRLDCSLLWTVAGAMLPDLIDKPLGRVGETDRYHSVAHSLLSVAIARAGVDRTPAARSLAGLSETRRCRRDGNETQRTLP